MPLFLKRWFSKARSASTSNGSTVVADANDSSEEEGLEEPVSQAPKRRKLNQTQDDFKFSHQYDTETSASNVTDMTVQPVPGQSTFRKETKFISTPLPPLNGLLDDDRPSTSGSQHPQGNVTKRRSLLNIDSPKYSDVTRKPQEQPALNISKQSPPPNFKSNFLCSPFHPGQSYGGVSSFHLSDFSTKPRPKPVVQSNNNDMDSIMSTSTRRIMDLLENYSSPFKDEAKRIPKRVPKPSNKSSFLSSLSRPQDIQSPRIATLLKMKQRNQLMENTNASREVAASSSSAPYIPLTLSDREKEKDSGKFTTKVKTSITRRTRDGALDDVLSPAIDLPNAVLNIDPAKLPKFSFDSSTQKPIASTVRNTTSLPETSTSSLSTSASKANKEGVPGKRPFQFSNPVKLPSDDQSLKKFLSENVQGRSLAYGTETKTNSSQTKPDEENKMEIVTKELDNTEKKLEVKRKKPDNMDSKINSEKKVEKENITETPKASNLMNGTGSSWLASPKTTNWQCPDCWAENKSEAMTCVCCGGKKLLKTNVASDPIKIFCDMSKSSPSSSNMFPVSNTFKWICGDCWVENNETDNKCVCCGASKPKPDGESKSTFAPPVVKPIENKNDDWSCSDCWVSNKSNVDKCVCCGGKRPQKAGETTQSSKVEATSKTAIKDTTFAKLVKSQQEKWECTSCLTYNLNDVTSCACCGARKLGADKAKLDFDFNAPVTFKFGIDNQKPLEELKKVEVAKSIVSTESKKVEPAETNNNVLPKAPAFTFGIPPKASTDVVDNSKKTEDVPPKPAFTFGVSNPIVSTAASEIPTFTFKTSVKPIIPLITPSVEVADKPQEVPEQKQPPKVPVDIVPPKTSSTLPATTLPAPVFSFGKPISSTPVTSAFVFSKEVSTPSTTSSISLGLTTTTTTTQPNLFTFTSNSILKPSATIADTAPAQNPLLNILAPKPNPPVISFNVNNNVTPVTTSSTSGFQLTPATTATSLLTKPANPVFSFGSVSQTPQATEEKPKFNFTFGSSTPTFGNNTAQKENVFGSLATNGPAPKENVFGSVPSSTNIFGANTGIGGNLQSNSVQKSTPFTFGAQPPTFGSTAPSFEAPQANSMFGSPSNAPAPSLFSAPMQSPPSVFGLPPSGTSTPVRTFQPPTANQTPMPTFGSGSLTSTPAMPTVPSFNFGSTPSFNFGGQSAPAMPFGASPPAGGVPSVQFNMGMSASSPNPSLANRKIRKATRRTTPR